VYDKYFLEQLLPSYVILGEPVQMDVVQEVQEIFLGCMNEVIDRTAVTFPVITACFSVTEEGGERIVNDTDFLDFISEYNLKYGFINIYMGKSSTLSSCCRLRSEAEGLGYSNSFGSGSTKIGSMGVVTLNLPRMAMLAIDMCEEYEESFDIFLEAVAGHALIAQTINAAKREFLKDRISRGSLPLYDLGYMSLKKQYSTCGFTGLYEALEILGYDITTEAGLECAEEVLAVIRKVNDHCTKEFGYPHNAEQVPAENSAVKLSQKDHIIGLYDGLEETDEPDYPIYSNQFIPLWKSDASILDRMEVQGRLDPWCDGGSILHINVGSPVTDIESMKNLIKLACKKGVVYFAINYVLHKCEHGHIWAGAELCPKCGGTSVDDLTRVVGFLTSIKNWNKTRREYDAPNRRFYDSVEN
jgi:ribonucleoside-triphosphate reductase